MALGRPMRWQASQPADPAGGLGPVYPKDSSEAEARNLLPFPIPTSVIH